MAAGVEIAAASLVRVSEAVQQNINFMCARSTERASVIKSVLHVPARLSRCGVAYHHRRSHTMKRTTITLVAIALAFGISGTAVAQGRHDDKPHGYDVKVAAAQQASAVTTTYVTLPSGPRAQDNPLRGKRIVVSQPKKEGPVATPQK
jgi:hypothetical protein